ncbi:MAG: DUF177 domain-containing protein [Candidatus Omnitrophica bacterium]|nr:DUF177 domain-containing protein [Candidatus Omnitrophota bacterium]
MKVRLSEIPSEGLTLSEPFDPAAMNLQTPEITFPAPLKVTALFQKERDTLFVRVEAQGERTMVCGRCLESYSDPYEGRFDLGYSVKGLVVLDLTDDIRQEILLTYPVVFLCKESCLGLCPACGKNLNTGACSCPR